MLTDRNFLSDSNSLILAHALRCQHISDLNWIFTKCELKLGRFVRSGPIKSGNDFFVARIFLSHSTTDSQIALSLASALENESLEMWLAPRDIPIGSNYAVEISNAISASDFMVVLLSPEAISSPHVKREVNMAVDKRITLLPVQLDNTPDFMEQLPEDWKYWLSLVQIVYFTDEKNTAARIRQQVVESREFESSRISSQRNQASLANNDSNQPSRRAAGVGVKKYSHQNGGNVEGRRNPKTRSPWVMRLVLLLTLLGVILGTIGFVQRQSNEPQSPSLSNPVKFSWSALVSGETQKQTGLGRTFKVLICDQNVISSSLRVIPDSERAKDSGPLSTSIVHDDPKCGTGFDSIFVLGLESKVPGTVSYVLTGSTKSAYKFKYDFLVTTSAK